MKKVISCWKVTEECYFVAQGETEEEALEKLADHAESAHRITLTEKMREKARTLMRQAA
jgi:predicted small metal-binding protein